MLTKSYELFHVYYIVMLLIGIAVAALLMLPIRAHCPLCTAAAGAGVAVTRFYGVDDAITGLWVGALIVSTALWLNKAIKKEFIKGQGLILSLLALLSIIIPLYLAGFMGGETNKTYFMLSSGAMFGIDKLLIGIVLGGIILEGAIRISKKIKETRGLLFPYQTITFIVGSLTIASILAWVII